MKGRERSTGEKSALGLPSEGVFRDVAFGPPGL